MITHVTEISTPPTPADPPTEFEQKAAKVWSELHQAVPQMNQQADEIEQIGADAQTAKERAIQESDAALGYRNETRAARDAALPAAVTATDMAAQAVTAKEQTEEARDEAQAAAASAANRVAKTSDTGAALLPEGNDAQRPATGSIPAGALVMRGNTQTVGGYIAEYWDRGASAWRALASRLWASHVFATRNEVINGCFQINQRAYASGAVTTSGQYTLDRWKVTGAAGFTFSTVENKTTVTIPAGQTLQQVIEGLNLQSGPYVLSWEGSAKGRIGAGAYGDSGVSANLVGGTNVTIEFNAGTLTNVRLDFGFASPGVRLPNFNEERRRCLRYYRTSYVGVKAGTISSAGAAVGGPYYNNSSGPSGVGCILANFDIPMRVAPTVSLYSPSTGAANNVFDNSDRSATVNALSAMGFYAGYAGNGSFVGTVHYVADAELA